MSAAEVSRREVVVFSGALYDAPLWTNRQHIATRLAARGWRVLYVEPRLWDARMALRFQGTHGYLRWRLRATYPFSWHAAPNLWITAQANLFPGSRRWPRIGQLNHWLFNSWRVRALARRLGFRTPVLLIYDTEAAEFLGDFPQSRVVYDCVDDHRVQAGVDRNIALVEREEAALIARADAISVTTEPLYARFAREHRNVVHVPNVGDVEAVLEALRGDPGDIAPIPHPRIGTVGALDAYKVDFPLLAAIARGHPAWQLVLIGPLNYSGTAGGDPSATRAVAALQQLPNVHFLGMKRREDIPTYLQAFDIAMIPYRESPYTQASFPLKFWEFVASGKPVVISGFPVDESARRWVSPAKGPDEFAAQIERALSSPEMGANERKAEALRHSWTHRVEAIERLLLPGEQENPPHGEGSNAPSSAV